MYKTSQKTKKFVERMTEHDKNDSRAENSEQ